MAVRLIVSIKAKAGRGSELAAMTLARTREVQKEPGCIQYEIFESAQNPDSLVLLETWTDQAALDVHIALMRSQPPNAAAAELRDGGATVERYTTE